MPNHSSPPDLRIHLLTPPLPAAPKVVALSDVIADAALNAFVADATLSASELIAATTWNLALYVVALEADDLADDADSSVLTAALEGLRRSVATVRRVDRERRQVQ